MPRGLSIRACNGVRVIIKPELYRSMRMVPAMPAIAAPPGPPAPPAAPRYLMSTTLH